MRGFPPAGPPDPCHALYMVSAEAGLVPARPRGSAPQAECLPWRAHRGVAKHKWHQIHHTITPAASTHIGNARERAFGLTDAGLEPPGELDLLLVYLIIRRDPKVLSRRENDLFQVDLGVGRHHATQTPAAPPLDAKCPEMAE